MNLVTVILIVIGYHHFKKRDSFRILIEPPPEEGARLKELSAVQHQYFHPFAPSHLQQSLDLRPEELFNNILIANGFGDHLHEVRRLHKLAVKPILFHKLYFKSLRPYQLASKHNVPFVYDRLKSSITPSYPSGHTAQAYYTALKLSQKYPSLKSQFFNIANLVAQSRIDRAVHFPSDIKGGIKLAKALHESGY